MARGGEVQHTPCEAGEPLLLQPAKSISEADISTVNLALRHRRRVMAAHPEPGVGHPDLGSGLSEQQLGRSSLGPNEAPRLGDATLAESPSSLSACDEASDDADGRARIAAAAWFDPLNRTGPDRRGRGPGLPVERGRPGLADGGYPMTRGTKVVVEVLGILLATALLTLTLSRLFMDVLAQVRQGGPALLPHRVDCRFEVSL